MKDELFPCPFCSIQLTPFYGINFFIHPLTTNCVLDEFKITNNSRTIKQWNTRTTPPAKGEE